MSPGLICGLTHSEKEIIHWASFKVLQGLQSLYRCSMGIMHYAHSAYKYEHKNMKILQHGMYKDFIDFSVLKDAQPGFFSQSALLLPD